MKDSLVKILVVMAKMLVGVLLLLATLVAIYFGWGCWVEYKPLMTKKFDSKEWKLVEEMESRPFHRRCGMYHDLTRNYLRKGMTIGEVEAMLGRIDTWSYCVNDKVKCSGYVMGVCYSNALSIVPMSVIVCFNRKGKLVNYGRNWPCETTGSYDLDTKEQSCMKETKGGGGVISNDCGIDPW